MFPLIPVPGSGLEDSCGPARRVQCWFDSTICWYSSGPKGWPACAWKLAPASMPRLHVSQTPKGLAVEI